MPRGLSSLGSAQVAVAPPLSFSLSLSLLIRLQTTWAYNFRSRFSPTLQAIYKVGLQDWQSKVGNLWKFTELISLFI